ncbi:MAG TPA: hypothetical protein VM491_18590 [Burkholderiaceae bacterium]|nr:hypothetical protein [Burkholderiaceae bacterium]
MSKTRDQSSTIRGNPERAAPSPVRERQPPESPSGQEAHQPPTAAPDAGATLNRPGESPRPEGND